MGAQDDVRFELLEMPNEFEARAAGEYLLNPIHPPREARIIGFLEHHAPQLRCFFDERHVAVGDHLAMERRKEFGEVELFDYVSRAKAAPGFIEGSGSGEMPCPGGYGSD